MEQLNTLLTSSTVLTVVAIIIVLAVIGGIALLFYKAKQKKWAKYPLLFFWFSGLMLAFDWLIELNDLRLSLLLSLGSGAIITLCFFLSDRRNKNKQ